MHSQPDLFLPTPTAPRSPLAVTAHCALTAKRPESAPFQQHSATSRAAAIEISKKLNPLQLAVLAFVVQRGALGATDEEIQNGLTMNPSTQRPRRIELERKGLVADSGTTRKTKAGRPAVVWVVR